MIPRLWRKGFNFYYCLSLDRFGLTDSLGKGVHKTPPPSQVWMSGRSVSRHLVTLHRCHVVDAAMAASGIVVVDPPAYALTHV